MTTPCTLGRVAKATRAVVACMCLAATVCVAQGRGGGPPPGGGPAPGGGPGGGMGGMNGGAPPERFPGDENGPPPQNSGQANSNASGVRPGLQVGPPGRWWDDKSFVKSLKLRPEQQARMDAIFEQNRSALVARFEGLHQAEAQMEHLAKSPNPEEGALFAQIDRVAQARAALEKATTHYLLQLRGEMDADQLARLAKRQ